MKILLINTHLTLEEDLCQQELIQKIIYKVNMLIFLLHQSKLIWSKMLLILFKIIINKEDFLNLLLLEFTKEIYPLVTLED